MNPPGPHSRETSHEKRVSFRLKTLHEERFTFHKRHILLQQRMGGWCGNVQEYGRLDSLP
jgi:hypothetical protein